jgi:hypothetical protein
MHSFIEIPLDLFVNSWQENRGNNQKKLNIIRILRCVIDKKRRIATNALIHRNSFRLIREFVGRKWEK